MDNKNNQVPPQYQVGPPPSYTESCIPPNQMPQSSDYNNLLHFAPNQLNNPSMNSSVIPVFPTNVPYQQLPNHQHSFVPNYGSTVILVNESDSRPLLPTENFVCPVCGIGLLEKEFTLLGVLLAIFLFPFGLLCLFILRKWKCSLCGSSLGY